jgi:uncharacterized membrane protein
MNRSVAVTVVVAVTIFAVFAALQPILPSNAEKSSDFGILGPNMSIGGYPANVTLGTAVHLYLYLVNHEGAVTYYQVLVKLGNDATQVSNTTASDAPEISSYSFVLADNESSTFPISLTLGTIGSNLKLIFELWSYNVSSSEFAYTGLSDQLLVNVTRGP